LLCNQAAQGLFLCFHTKRADKNQWERVLRMSATTLQARINFKKRLFLQTLKEQGVFIEYCPKRGYIYEIIQPILGCITRVIVALKNGAFHVIEMEPTKV